jgi:acid phosphatase (class A)
MKLRLALFLASVLILPAAFAAAPVTHDFLAEGALDGTKLLPPPPDEASIAGQGEHEILADLDAHRTAEQAALAKYYEPLDVFRMLAPVLGVEATEQNLPATAAFFKQVRLEARPVVLAAKEAWKRQRPYIYNPAISPAVEKPNNNSYPSGHSTDSALYATLLCAILPDLTADWQKQAGLVRWSRLVGGAHYPSDVMAGKLLGETIGREMLKSPKLQHALEAVRAELTAKLLKKAA